MRSLIVSLTVGLLLVACTTVKAPQGSVSSNKSEATQEEQDIQRWTPPPGFGVQIDKDTPAPVVNARDYVAVERKLSPTQVAVGHMQEMEFPDDCLGFPADGESCVPQKTPGYMIMVLAEGMLFMFHTNADGSDMRLINPYDVHIGMPGWAPTL